MLLDGYSLINRAFYGLSGRNLLATSDGVVTNAIFGFLNILHKLLEEENPEFIAVAFDVKKPTFRHKEYEGYKQGRKKTPEELTTQVPYIRDILGMMNINVVELEGYEADDIIGTLAKKASSIGVSSVVVSGDRDLLQIVDKNIRVKVPITKFGNTTIEDYDMDAIYEKYKLQPHQLVELKGIMGDSSDNIPGIKGIGEKTALPLIQDYGTIDEIYENIENLKGATKLKFENGREDAILSKRLGTIVCDVPIGFDMESFKKKDYDKVKLLEMFDRLEFKSLKVKFFKDEEIVEKRPTIEVELKEIVDNDDIRNLRQEALKNASVGLVFCQNEDSNNLCIYVKGNIVNLIRLDSFKENEDLKALLEEDNIKKYVYSLKEVVRAFRNKSLNVASGMFDVQIAGYIVDSSSQKYSLIDLIDSYLDECVEELETNGNGDYARAIAVHKLGEVLEKKIQEISCSSLFYDVEMPLAFVLESMESEGIKVDKSALKVYFDELSIKITDLEKKIYQYASQEFNINSPKQLGVILFEKLGLPPSKKTKTGYSTNVEVLESLKGKHDIIDSILEYRHLEKLKNTYAKPLYEMIDDKTSKIHTKFNQTGTVTGRVTSVEPNLQNIPYKLEYGRKIRKVFVPSSKEHILLGADYSQIELRILAHISEDDNLIDAFKNEKDIHAITASRIFGVEESEVTAFQRSSAKAINFGIMYGLGEFSLSKDLSITRKEAKKYIETYLGQYPMVKEYMGRIVEYAKEKGFVTTILGRRRSIPEIGSTNFNIRSFGERVALNAPIQGSAADVLKLAMVRISDELKKKNLKSKLILQVHDEVIVDVLKTELEDVHQIVTQSMETVVDLKVPLLVQVETGDSWYETK